MHSLGCFFGEGTAIASRRRVVWGFRAGAEQAGTGTPFDGVTGSG